MGEGDAVCAREVGEVWGVGRELARFSEIDECADARCEEFVEFLRGRLEGGPGVLACEEVWCCPVRVGDGAGSVSVEGRKRRATSW